MHLSMWYLYLPELAELSATLLSLSLEPLAEGASEVGRQRIGVELERTLQVRLDPADENHVRTLGLVDREAGIFTYLEFADSCHQFFRNRIHFAGCGSRGFGFTAGHMDRFLDGFNVLRD